MKPNVSPQFNIIRDVASEIPWELLEESYWQCSGCRRITPPHRPHDSAQIFCSYCRQRLTPVGGKLSLTHHLSHLLPSKARPASEGSQFLIIQDPTEVLLDQNNDPSGFCRQHLEDVQGSSRSSATGYACWPIDAPPRAAACCRR